MTFYEAALRVLEEAGTPLLSADITRLAIEKGLLSHIGKNPDITMLSRLAAMAKRSRDRRVQVTVKDTFALIDWMLPEDPEALAQTGVFEPNPEEALPPYRPEERHPEAHAEYLRAIGRQGDRKRSREDERKRKFPPLAEVAFEALEEANTALVLAELLARLKQREGVADDFGTHALIDGLASANQRRVDEGRKPQFAAVRTENNELQISMEPQAEGGPAPIEVQQAFCAACNLPFENGRVKLKSELRARREDREAREPREPRGEIAPTLLSEDDAAAIANARHAGKDARKAMARVLRKRLSELEFHVFEKSCVRMLHGLHFRELKVSRRSKEGPLLSARRREGSLEIRYAVRLIKSAQVDRKHVQELRRELTQTGANIGLILSPGDARGDARAECTNGPLVMLWAGDSLADKFFEAKVGVSVQTIEIYDIDEAFFAQAKIDAEESLKRREERHKEREQRSPQATPPMPVETEGAAAPQDVAAQGEAEAPTPSTEMPAAIAAEGAEGADEEDDGEEGDEGEEGAAAAPGEPGEAGEGKRRRRRRRRRRRGASPKVEGAPGADGAAAPVSADGSAPIVQGTPIEGTSEGTPAVEAAPAPVASEPAAPAEPAPAAPSEPTEKS